MAAKNQMQSKMNLVCMESETFSHQGEVVWSIKNFVSKLESHIISLEFSVVPSCKIRLQLRLMLQNPKRNTTIVYIDRKDKGPNYVSAEIQCSFQNNGDVFPFPTIEHILHAVVQHSSSSATPNTFFTQHNYPISVQCNSFLPWDLSKYSSDDILILRCQLKLKSCCDATQFVQTDEYKTSLGYQLPTDLITSLRKLHNDKQFTDFKIKVGETTFAAHKAILAVRSPVFQKMLEYEMSEKQNDAIEITDVQPKIMAAFLSFLYTSVVEDLTIDEFRQLFAVADKYQVDSLKDRCTSLLLKNLDEQTVCKTLKLADMHNNDIMKEIAASFISENFSTLRTNPEFIRLMDSDPRLVLHIVMAHSMQPQTTDPSPERQPIPVRPATVAPPNYTYTTIPITTASASNYDARQQSYGVFMQQAPVSYVGNPYPTNPYHWSHRMNGN